MAKLKGFFNQVLKNNRIFTAEDIGEMSSKEFGENEKAIDYQTGTLGIPYRRDLQDNDDVEFVSGYTRADGTQVKAHYRAKSDSMPNPKPTYNAPTGFATGINNVQQPKKQAGIPVSVANLGNALFDLNFAKNNENVKILNSRSEVTDIGLNNLLDQVKVPQTSRGVFYEPNSVQSKNLWASNEIQNFVNNNRSNLYGNNNPTAHIEFTRKNDIDNFLGIQNSKLYNPHITPDGYFDGMVVDYYDFAQRNGKWNDIPVMLNNMGYGLQELGLLENYFNIYHIREKL